jgi:hypothetical protein
MSSQRRHPAENCDINLAGDDRGQGHVLIVDDDALMRELFDDYLDQYRDMAAHADIYWKDLMRSQEELVLIPVQA